MDNIVIFLLLLILIIVTTPYLYEAALHVIRNWSRTTTLFVWIITILVVILLVARNIS